jgi:hypothetical protein
MDGDQLLVSLTLTMPRGLRIEDLKIPAVRNPAAPRLSELQFSPWDGPVRILSRTGRAG